MKIFSKKISLGVGFTILFAVASIVYSLGYKIAMNKLNTLVSFTREKQKMYSDLSEIDYNIRNLYIGNANESKILNGMYKGYLSSLEDENCMFLTREEYNSYLNQKNSQSAEISWDILNDRIGYLYCKTFGKGSAEIFLERINYFSSIGIKDIILDLRTSYEGSIEEGFNILKNILSEENLVYLVSKNGKKEVVCKSENKDNLNLNLVLLTSKNSGIVAEIISSALKDCLNAKIIGENTKGNFIREKTVEISEDFVIIFPDAKYITFSEQDLYKKGLAADKNVEISEDTIKMLEDGNLPYSEDEALNYAIDLMGN